MRIYTKVVMDWNGNVLEREGFEYNGPLALCDRSTSKKIANQGIANSEQDQTNAQSALTQTNKALGDYSSNLSKFMQFGRDTYGENGEFMKDQNTLANTTAAAGSNAIKGNLALNAMRTGANTAGYADTVAESQRSADRDLTTQLAGADASRLQNLTNINQFGVTASALPAEVQSQLYGSSLSASNGALGVAANASGNQKSFGDVFGQTFASDLADNISGKNASQMAAAAG